MEALQQKSLSSLHISNSLLPSSSSSSCARTPSSSSLKLLRGSNNNNNNNNNNHSNGSSNATSFFQGSSMGALKAKVQEQGRCSALPRDGGDGSSSSSRRRRRPRVVSMAKSAASGYAAALAEVGKANGILESVAKDVEALAKYFQDDQFWGFIVNPVAKVEEKKAIVSEVCKEAKLQPVTANLLNLIVEKKRTIILRDLVKEFEVLYNELTDTQVAVVTSAVEIQAPQLSLIGKKVQALSGSKSVKLKNVIDPSIIAGFVVRFGKDGSRLIDMSVKGQLDKIASQINLADQLEPAV